MNKALLSLFIWNSSCIDLKWYLNTCYIYLPRELSSLIHKEFNQKTCEISSEFVFTVNFLWKWPVSEILSKFFVNKRILKFLTENLSEFKFWIKYLNSEIFFKIQRFFDLVTSENASWIRLQIQEDLFHQRGCLICKKVPIIVDQILDHMEDVMFPQFHPFLVLVSI